ncbi:intradiol ring-cleavage dioxygenase [Kineococcus sp. NUM-3379]
MEQQQVRRQDGWGSRPAYEGRLLDRPQEDVEDQGLRFDVETLLGRRRVLRFLGVGAAASVLAACGDTATPAGTSTETSATSGEIPDETAGPYPGDGSNGPDALEQSGIVRGDIRSSFAGATGAAAGVPVTLELTVTDLANGGVPFAGAAVYVWHADREGRYSMYSDGITGENYLRGVQVAGADGTVRFTSVFPGCYDGRWPHVHFEVYPDLAATTDAGNAVATSQLALPQAACDAVYATAGYEASVENLSRVSLGSDNVFGDDGGASQLGTATGDVTAGYTVTLPVGVDTGTLPTGGQPPSGGGAPGGVGGPPPGGAPAQRG